jgi:hypothetical protein
MEVEGSQSPAEAGALSLKITETEVKNHTKKGAQELECSARGIYVRKCTS